MTKELKAYNVKEIPGMIKFDLPVHEDHRGWFKENFQKEKMVELGFPIDFFTSTEKEGNKLQNNISFSKNFNFVKNIFQNKSLLWELTWSSC